MTSESVVIEKPGVEESLDSSADVSNDLDAVRRLLFVDEREQLADLHRKLATLEQTIAERQINATNISDVLVPAIDIELAKGDQLSNSFKPVVVDQFHRAAREEPDDMADALFPILGPAIRKMIASMLTPDSNSKKRRYRVEQLFLIDKQSGLPICHAVGDAVTAHDADMVSGMLNAIQSFVHEAFSANEFDGLDQLQVGELAVWIEWGPEAVLAAVVRGKAPQKLRESMQVQLETIHLQYPQELSDYQGDSVSFEPLQPELVDFLDNHDGSLKTAIKGLSFNAKLAAGVALFAGVAVIGSWLYGTYKASQWQDYLAVLEKEPGLVIVHQEQESGKYLVTGLKDPLAKDPVVLLKDTGIDAKRVSYQLKPFQSLHTEFVLTRLQAALSPPDNVQMAINGSTLKVTGAVDASWMQDTRRLVLATPGVNGVIFTTE